MRASLCGRPPMEQSPLIEYGLPLSLMIIMAGMGLGLTFGEFRQVFVRPRAMVVGTVAQVILIPLIAFGLASAMGLRPEIAIGLVIIAACPGGTTSNIFTLLARGNVALSITLTVLASLLTILTIPLFTNHALDLYATGEAAQTVRLPIVRTVFTLLAVVVVPVLLGMGVRRISLSFAQRAEPYVGRFGLLVLVVLILAIVYGTRNEILSLLAQAGPAAAALSIVGIGAGFLSSRLLGVSTRDGLTIAIEVGIKNGTIGLMVTLTLLQSAQMAIPSAVYGVQMYIFGGALVVWGRRRSPEAVPLQHGQEPG
ncbi:MAG: bile acid:sodium symporter family protein [Myxococcota bacterium]